LKQTEHIFHTKQSIFSYQREYIFGIGCTRCQNFVSLYEDVTENQSNFEKNQQNICSERVTGVFFGHSATQANALHYIIGSILLRAAIAPNPGNRGHADQI